ncbi:hypothetical protein MCOR27_005689 [Pyricularia oryzae]|uniref:Developmental regulator n=1 Tax=Pyricularia grisea TaxID=148305 RepID=A0ABQ8NSU9_PYRGI|nr:hypothetical protein MCOR01_008374 [Pyricularia oryzae]KAI6301633.1 hypothetical protein MCOR33_002910 [Pyricularia grisea]KAI6258114.1 hypothetical protein MCOR19_005504 [Pyricularia oryzae]KAI6268027.1 hypothetical protein MCOR26_009414 [Pyricularia oryzae]KAI6278275.1 hypothetical protein MCOR27_005689 [Pyricularia oryzae]
MPTYLCHGFRWHRPSIRVYVIVQDIGDAAPDFISGTRSATAILDSFYNLFDFLPPPKTRDDQQKQPPAATDSASSQAWSAIRLLEEYDPSMLGEAARPHAYVADHVVRVDLSASVVDEMARYQARLKESGAMGGPHSDETGRRQRAAKDRKAGWLEKLRDQLQRGEEIRWYVVVNGDEERGWDHGGGDGGEGEEVDDFADGQGDSVVDERRELERQELRQRLGGIYIDEEDGDNYGYQVDDSSSRHTKGPSDNGMQPLSVMPPQGVASKPTTKGTGSGFRRLFGKGSKSSGDLK